MLNVACVLRSGGSYTPSDVEKLHAMVTRHLKYGEFYCLTDMVLEVGKIEDVRPIKLEHAYPGWWSKMELFRPTVFPEGDRILFLDLDTIILGNLEAIAARQEHWIMLGDFYRRPPKHARIGLASGMMMWTANDQDQIYQSFARQPSRVISTVRGDQDWIARQNPTAVLWENVVPGQVVSYKVHVRETGKVPDDARVVCFHGSPKPSEVKEDWVLKHWTEDLRCPQ